MQVKCCECGYESNTVDDFLHISLEITRAHSLTKALQRFTTGEYLDQENKYKCPKQVHTITHLLVQFTLPPCRATSRHLPLSSLLSYMASSQTLLCV